MRHSIEVLKTDDASSTVPRIRRGNWRATLVGALVGLLIVMVLLMKWLMEHQVEAAAQRRALEAAARAAVAHCFELASPRAVDACRKAQEVSDSSDFKVIKSDSGKP
jgi:L-lactate permease